MELTNTPSIDNFDENEWIDWLLENMNAVNKSDLSKDEKRKLYCKIVNKIVDCGYYICYWED